jgi:hypothetical protein
MDTKTFSIGFLAATALFLLIACLLGPAARADFAIKDRDYQLITASTSDGGEALYIIDARSGKMAVFAFDRVTHVLRPVAAADDLAHAFH